MLSLILIGLIVYIVGYIIIPFKVKLNRVNVDVPRMKKRPYITNTKDYVTYIGGVSYTTYDIPANIFIWFILGLGLCLIGGYSELLCADIQWGIIQSGICAILGFFVYPAIGAFVIVLNLNTREEDKKKYCKKIHNYISWGTKDEEFMAADCFFCNVIIEGKVPESTLDEIKAFRNNCHKGGGLNISEAEPYLNALNAIRKQRGLNIAYLDLLKRCAESNGKTEVRSEASAANKKIQMSDSRKDAVDENTSNAVQSPRKIKSTIERKYDALWQEISQLANDKSLELKYASYELFDLLEEIFRAVYYIDKKKSVCHSGGYTNRDLPMFVLGYLMAIEIYKGDEQTIIINSRKKRKKEVVQGYERTIIKFLAHESETQLIKQKIREKEISAIMDAYKSIPQNVDCFDKKGKYEELIPVDFKNFVIGYYAGTNMFQNELLSEMRQSWEKCHKKPAANPIQKNYIVEKKVKSQLETDVKENPVAQETVMPDDVPEVELIEETVVETPSPKTKESYAAIAKQMANSADPYRAIWDRMRNDIGINDSRFKRRLTKNTAHLENIYRKQMKIEPYKELYNVHGFVDNDFFAFMLGYILADHLFNDDDKMTAHASESGSYDYESEVEYEDADLWNDGTDEILPEEISDEYDGDDFDTDDYDSEDYHLDEDFAGVDRDATFQDDYGFNGDDMYSFDGEFIE